jgi:alcohol dehydrogenase class IV
LGVREGIDGVVGVGGGARWTPEGGQAAADESSSAPPIFRQGGRCNKAKRSMIVIPTTAGTGQ